jgi:hypothetical protein
MNEMRRLINLVESAEQQQLDEGFINRWFNPFSKEYWDALKNDVKNVGSGVKQFKVLTVDSEEEFNQWLNANPQHSQAKPLLTKITLTDQELAILDKAFDEYLADKKLDRQADGNVKESLQEGAFKKLAMAAGLATALAGAPQDAQAGTDVSVDYSKPVISGHLDTDKTDADKVYNTNVRVIATSVTQAILKDSQGKPVKGGVSDKWEIKEFVSGTGMARVQIQYVLNGKQTAQVQINWHEYKINSVSIAKTMPIRDMDRDRLDISGFNGLDIRTLKKGTNEQLEEGIADKVKGAILGAAITFAAINTDLDKVFVEPATGSIEQFKATDKPTNTTIAVVDPDTKEVKPVKPQAQPINTDLVDLEMKKWIRNDPYVLGYVIKGDTLVIKLSDRIYKGYHAYLDNVKSGRMRDMGIKDAYEYAGFTNNVRQGSMKWASQAGIKDVKYSTNVTIPAQSKEPEKEKTPYLTRPGDKGKYKIISTRPWRGDPDNVTVILTMRVNADGTKTFSVQGIDVKNNLAYVQAYGQRNSSEDYTQMKDIFRSSNGINFDSKGVDIGYGTIQAMYRQELKRSDRGVKSSAPKKDSTSVKAYKDAIAKRDKNDSPLTNKDEVEKNIQDYLDKWEGLNGVVSKVTDRYDSIQRFKVDEDSKTVKIYFKSPYDKGSNKDKRYVENTLAKVKERLERKSDIDTVKFYRIKS